MTVQAYPVVIIATAGARDEAEKLGESLVENDLAASVSVVPMIHSMYKDQEGRLVREHEAMLVVRTSSAKASDVAGHLRAHHSYRLPEVLALEVVEGSRPYIDWLMSQVGPWP